MAGEVSEFTTGDVDRDDRWYRSLVELSPVVVAVADRHGVFTYVSSSVHSLTGYSPEELVGRSAFDFLDPVDAIRVAEQFGRMVSDGGIRFQQETGVVTKTGQRIVLEATALNKLDDDAIGGVIIHYYDIGRRRSAVEALSRTQDAREETQAAAHIGSFEWDMKTDLLAWSPEQFRIFGHPPASMDVDLESFFDAVHPDDRDRIRGEISEAKKDGTPYVMEFRSLRPDGEVRWINGWGEFLFEGATPIRLMGQSQDVTERRLMEEELRASGELLRGILRNSPAMISVKDQDGRYVLCNRPALRFYGLTVDNVIGRTDQEIFAEDVARAHSQIDLEVIRTGPLSFEETLVNADGPRTFLSLKFPLKGPDGRASAICSISTDISDRIRSQVASQQLQGQLDAGEALFRAAFTATHTGVALIDGDLLTYVDVNPALCEMLGYSREELLALTWRDITLLADLPGNDAAIALMMDTGKGFNHLQKRYVRKDGRVITVDVTNSLIRDEAGKPHSFVAHIVDITEQEEAVRDLKESKELLQAVVNNSPALIYIKDRTGKYLLVSDKVAEHVGRSREEILGSELSDLYPSAPSTPLSLQADERVFSELVPIEVEEVFPSANGELRTYLTLKFPLFDQSDSCYALCGISTDITDRQRETEEKGKLEAQLNQAQKMEAVGQLAGGVAHDFNNILSVILNYAQFLSEDIDPPDPRLDDLNEITKAGHRAAELVSQLLSFSRKEVIEPKIVNLNDVIEGMEQLLRRSIGEDIDLRFALPSGLPLIKADPGKLEQILLNLAVNARDAMPQGGPLVVTTACEAVEDQARPGLAEGQYVVMRVSDEGEGIPQHIVDRIFEPFFTTKKLGRGTGLGLATVYGIVKQSSGSIYVDTELGAGTTFSVYMPVTEESISELGEDSAVTTHADSTVGQGGTIVLVEDEEAVRTLVSKMLTRDGFDVVAFAGGAEAIEYFRSNPGEVQLLLTDVVMPEMSGKALSDALHESQPNLKTLFMSGYTDEIIAQRGVLAGDEQLIAKPFDRSQLIARISSILHPGAPRDV